jgi:hypothetical protein
LRRGISEQKTGVPLALLEKRDVKDFLSFLKKLFPADQGWEEDFFSFVIVQLTLTNCP